MKWVVCAILVAACGDDRLGADGGLSVPDGTADTLGGDLFGEACTQPPFPEIGICREGEGACHDEPGGSVCRPFCHVSGQPQCAARNGVEVETDRGACVCVPP
jgi:hypothetical protein